MLTALVLSGALSFAAVPQDKGLRDTPHVGHPYPVQGLIDLKPIVEPLTKVQGHMDAIAKEVHSLKGDVVGAASWGSFLGGLGLGVVLTVVLQQAALFVLVGKGR